MKVSKFYDVQTNNGYKTININNIALIESSGIRTKITMDIKDENGNEISFNTILPWATISSNIKHLDLNQSEL
jgi:hypothetical protein